MTTKEKKIVELGKQLSRSLSTVVDSLVETDGLDSVFIEMAASLIERIRENNDQHNKLVDKETKSKS